MPRPEEPVSGGSGSEDETSERPTGAAGNTCLPREENMPEGEFIALHEEEEGASSGRELQKQDKVRCWLLIWGPFYLK